MTTRSLLGLTCLGLVASALSPAPPTRASPHQDALKDSLITLEKESWRAWQQCDGAFSQKFLSDDHVEVGFRGVSRWSLPASAVLPARCRASRWTRSG